MEQTIIADYSKMFSKANRNLQNEHHAVLKKT